MSFLRPVCLRPLSQGVRDWGMGAGVVVEWLSRAAALQGEVLDWKIWLSVRIYNCVQISLRSALEKPLP